MASAKKTLQGLLDRLPDNISYEELMKILPKVAEELGSKIGSLIYSGKQSAKNSEKSPIENIIHQSIDYLNYLNKSNEYPRFHKFLYNSIIISIERTNKIPIAINFDLFVLPDEALQFPMVKIFFEEDKDIDWGKIRDQFHEDLKNFLITNAETEQDYLDLRKIQRELKIFIRWGN
jgi:hypothetical protein